MIFRFLSLMVVPALGTGLALLPSTGMASDEATSWRYPAGLVSERVIDPVNTDWRTLLGLNYRTGEVTPALAARRGKSVRIPGFMVPFEDGVAGVNEFLLVPYFGACIHTPPPPPNQIVYVRMNGGARVEVNIWDAVYVEGVLEIESIESPYGTVGHQLRGTAVRPYTGEQ